MSVVENPPLPLRQAVSKAYATAYAGAYATSADIYQTMNEFHTEVLTPSLCHKLTQSLRRELTPNALPNGLRQGRGGFDDAHMCLFSVRPGRAVSSASREQPAGRRLSFIQALRDMRRPHFCLVWVNGEFLGFLEF